PTHPSFASKPRTLRMLLPWNCHRVQCSATARGFSPRSAQNTCRPASSGGRLAAPSAFVLVLFPVSEHPPRSDAALFIFRGIEPGIQRECAQHFEQVAVAAAVDA